MLVRRRLIVQGKVQGVWYRASCAEQAAALGISGWAANLPDGTVEVVAEGEAEAVHQLEQWCQHGPPGAHVAAVAAHNEPARGDRSFITR